MPLDQSETTNVGGIAADQLRSYIERIERLDEEKSALSQDMKEVFAEAKANGFDVKVMRQILKERKLDKDDRAEAETLLNLYRKALGMQPSML
jgi:uncharacterized protein (UPF0335 family)